ncbi:MAG: hypothetical protein Q9157_007931 [Trypethelium eluteriae]
MVARWQHIVHSAIGILPARKRSKQRGIYHGWKPESRVDNLLDLTGKLAWVIVNWIVLHFGYIWFFRAQFG